MSRRSIISCDRFCSQIPTWAISRWIDRLSSSFEQKSKYPDEASSQVVDFLHKTPPEQYLDAYIGCYQFLNRNKNIPTKYHLRWSIFFTNPYLSKIQRHRYVVWQILWISYELLNNCLTIASPNKVDWRKVGFRIEHKNETVENRFPGE